MHLGQSSTSFKETALSTSIASLEMFKKWNFPTPDGEPQESEGGSDAG